MMQNINIFIIFASDILSLDDKIIKEYASVREAVEKTGFFTGCIVDNCKGRQKTSHGYIFKYKEDLR